MKTRTRSARSNLFVTLCGVGASVLIAGHASASTVAYWQLDESGTNYTDAVGGHTLTRLTGTQTTLRGPDPIPNPDSSTFTTGTPAANPFAETNPSASLVSTSASAFFHMGATSFTLEGYFRNAAAPGTESGLQFIAGDRMPSSTSYTTGSPLNNGSNFGGWMVNMSNGKIQFFAQNGVAGPGQPTVSINSVTRYDDQAFHSFAVVWDAAADPDANAGNGIQGQLSLYVDGTLQGSVAGLGSLVSGGQTYSDTFAIGARRVGTGPTNQLNNSPWLGQLDELRFSNTVLSPSQLLSYTVAIPDPAALPAGLALLGLVAFQSRRATR